MAEGVARLIYSRDIHKNIGSTPRRRPEPTRAYFCLSSLSSFIHARSCIHSPLGIGITLDIFLDLYIFPTLPSTRHVQRASQRGASDCDYQHSPSESSHCSLPRAPRSMAKPRPAGYASESPRSQTCFTSRELLFRSNGVEVAFLVVADLVRFSSGALSQLPTRGQGARAKSKRADRIPDECVAQFHAASFLRVCNRMLMPRSGRRQSVNDYHTINGSSVRIRVPKKVLTPVKVEAKVWFANERTFISYLSMGLLMSTIASGLLFGARDSMARYFALAYAGM